MNLVRRISMQPNLGRSVQSYVPTTKNLLKGSNQTTMVGTVINVIDMAYGASAVLLRTYDENHFYAMHKIVIPNYKLEKMPPISAGQKVFVTGKMRLKEIIKSNGKKSSTVEISARQIYICDTGDDTNFKSESSIETSEDREGEVNNPLNVLVQDKNHVELCDMISFEVINEEKFSLFYVASHFFRPDDSSGVRREYVDFIPIFIYDEQLRAYVQSHLKRLDRVRVEGVIKYKSAVDDAGKSRNIGYVLAKKITKMVSIHKVNTPSSRPLKSSKVV